MKIKVGKSFSIKINSHNDKKYKEKSEIAQEIK